MKDRLKIWYDKPNDLYRVYLKGNELYAIEGGLWNGKSISLLSDSLIDEGETGIINIAGTQVDITKRVDDPPEVKEPIIPQIDLSLLTEVNEKIDGLITYREFDELLKKHIIPVDNSDVIGKISDIGKSLIKREQNISASVFDASESVSLSISENKTSVEKDIVSAKKEILELVKKLSAANSSVKKELSELINSKIYNPEIKVDTVSFIEEVIRIKTEILKALVKAVDDLKAEIIKKRKWKFTIQKDSSGSITGAIAEQV